MALIQEITTVFTHTRKLMHSPLLRSSRVLSYQPSNHTPPTTYGPSWGNRQRRSPTALTVLTVEAPVPDGATLTRTALLL